MVEPETSFPELETSLPSTLPVTGPDPTPAILGPDPVPAVAGPEVIRALEGPDPPPALEGPRPPLQLEGPAPRPALEYQSRRSRKRAPDPTTPLPGQVHKREKKRGESRSLSPPARASSTPPSPMHPTRLDPGEDPLTSPPRRRPLRAAAAAALPLYHAASEAYNRHLKPVKRLTEPRRKPDPSK